MIGMPQSPDERRVNKNGSPPVRGSRVRRTWSHLLVLAACIAAWNPAPAVAATAARIQLPATITEGGQRFELVSCGIRDSLWIDHYAAGLYLPRGTGVAGVGDSQVAKAVRIEMISVRYMPEQIPDKWLVALERELAPSPLSRLRRAYRGLDDGDVMTIAYRPQVGVTVRVNGNRVVQVRHHGVISAVLEAWAGETPVVNKLEQLASEHPCGSKRPVASDESKPHRSRLAV